MKNDQGEIIYIGKAKDLFKRVGSYFRQIDKHSPKTKKMVENISDLDYTVTNSELEALILETNLIKENRPKYNVLMKDDKNYAYIKITVNEDYPRILVVRKVLNDKAKYFGPKTNASQIYDMLRLLRQIFPFRNCNLQIEDLGPAQADDINKKRVVKVTHAGIKYPCLDLHIKRCQAPCIGKPDKQEYRETINKIIDLLDGKYQEIEAELKSKMFQAAGDKKFEQAAKLRDKILSIENIFQNQLVSSPDHQNSDVINFFCRDEHAYFNVFQVREGKLIDQQNFIVKIPPIDSNPESLFTYFLQEFYSQNNHYPREILVPLVLPEQELLQTWLEELSGHKVKITTPQKGKKDRLLELSLENAFSFAKQSRAKWEGETRENREEALEKIAQIAGLPDLPRRIECYDISHLGGTNTVASMAVFENGYPKTDHYRHFKISLEEAGAPDDFRSMKEVILRRLKYLKPSLGHGKISIKKGKESYQIKIDKKPLAEFRLISFSKLKVFVAPFHLPPLSEELISAMVEKFHTKRLYLQIPNKHLALFEKTGFQQVKIDLEEYPAKKSHTVVVFDKTRNFQDASFSKKPDLIVIDGGKGQLSFAVKALEDFQLVIPIMSLAKKNEEFFLPDRDESVQLSENNPARLLIQHLRDEAHRFAIEYNRKLRKKDYTFSELEQVPGIGKLTVRKLLRHFGSLENIKNQSEETLAAVVGTKIALKIKSFFNK
jgi:excinuclease ABC subunit C